MDEVSLINIQANVRTYDKITKWSEPDGLSSVQIYQHVPTGTFRIVGRKLQDQEISLNCPITSSIHYNVASEGFHQWRVNSGNSTAIYGLNFRSRADSESFFRCIKPILDSLASSATGVGVPIAIQQQQQQPPQTMSQSQQQVHIQQQVQAQQQVHGQQQIHGQQQVQSQHLQQQEQIQQIQSRLLLAQRAPTPQQVQHAPQQSQMQIQMQQQQQQQHVQRQHAPNIQQHVQHQPPSQQALASNQVPVHQVQPAQQHIQQQLVQQAPPPPPLSAVSHQQKLTSGPPSPPPTQSHQTQPQINTQMQQQPSNQINVNGTNNSELAASKAPPTSVVPQPPPPPPPPAPPAPPSLYFGAQSVVGNNASPNANAPAANGNEIVNNLQNHSPVVNGNPNSLEAQLANCRLRKTNIVRADSDRDGGDTVSMKNSRTGSVTSGANPRQLMMNDLSRALARRAQRGESQDGDTQSLNDQNNKLNKNNRDNNTKLTNGSIDSNDLNSVIAEMRKDIEIMKEDMKKMKVEIINSIEALTAELKRR